MAPDKNQKTNYSDSKIAYNPLLLEESWQAKWERTGLYKTKEAKTNQKKFYALSMFPYPSGRLHMGHVRNYVITDVIARYRRMLGDTVLHPMGWDAFGLPAENAAIDRGIEADVWTNQNIEQMKLQLKRLGLSIDWDREIRTCHEDYYKWTQYIFLELLEAGLAYQKLSTVNWDPVDKTVLANEQVDSQGRSWRSGAKVEKKKLKQWFLKITDFAEDLINDLNLLSGWPENVKTMQLNWIGRSEGTEIKFKIKNSNELITIFTTRPDTLYGSTYLVLAPDHPLVEQLVTEKNKNRFTDFKYKISNLSETDRTSENKEKQGMFIGSYAINPANDREIPIWIADYVLSSYATGAVMGVPAHDQRDYDFAKKYKLEISYVIYNQQTKIKDIQNKAYTSSGILVNSEEFNGKDSEEAKTLITDKGITNNWASRKISYKLRDWLISRQRYWGCPIPVVHCSECGVVPFPKNLLPLKLSKPDKNNTYKTIKCPSCNQSAKIETDTMDTFMCSSWYFLRYVDSRNKALPFNSNLINDWLPVNQYVGGIEHAILHLLYSRFIVKALNSRGLLNIKEPFERLLTQGMVQGITYRNRRTYKYIASEDIKDIMNPCDPDTGDELEVLYEKMSKSKFNGVDPESVIGKYGTDTARMFILFKAPPEKDLEWDDSDVEGQYRFLNRLWRLIIVIKNRQTYKSENYRKLSIPKDLNNSEKVLRKVLHTTIKEITSDLDQNSQVNTAISELMILCNSLYNNLEQCRNTVINESILNLTLLLSPFAPHLAEEFWSLLEQEGSVHNQEWPIFEVSALIERKYKLIIQINGKVRGSVDVDTDDNEELLKQKALATDIVIKWLDKKELKRIIVIKGKIINIVV